MFAPYSARLVDADGSPPWPLRIARRHAAADFGWPVSPARLATVHDDQLDDAGHVAPTLDIAIGDQARLSLRDAILDGRQQQGFATGARFSRRDRGDVAIAALRGHRRGRCRIDVRRSQYGRE